MILVHSCSLVQTSWEGFLPTWSRTAKLHKAFAATKLRKTKPCCVLLIVQKNRRAPVDMDLPFLQSDFIDLNVVKSRVPHGPNWASQPDELPVVQLDKSSELGMDVSFWLFKNTWKNENKSNSKYQFWGSWKPNASFSGPFHLDRHTQAFSPVVAMEALQWDCWTWGFHDIHWAVDEILTCKNREIESLMKRWKKMEDERDEIRHNFREMRQELVHFFLETLSSRLAVQQPCRQQDQLLKTLAAHQIYHLPWG